LVAAQRGYRYQTNPLIQLFDNVNLTFQLAINTAQYGRVFQDRFEDLFLTKQNKNYLDYLDHLHSKFDNVQQNIKINLFII
jgi:hypothetical protein